MRQYLSERSWYRLVEDVCPIDNSDFEILWALHPEQRDNIMMFGKEVQIPRYQKLYGNKVEYRYSGKNLISAPIENPVLQSCLDWVNDYEPDINYNGMLVNWYQNGQHYMGLHSDDERDLVQHAPIFSFSFGAERVFRISHKQNSDKIDVVLKHGSLLVMGGDMQQEFKHALPKSAKCKSPRINLTIRAFTTQFL